MKDKIDDTFRNTVYLPTRNGVEKGRGKLIGKSLAMQRVLERIRQVAPGNANIMVTGESGVGKELVVRSIHEQSSRRDKPFIAVNCGAVPPALFESELFGYRKGAFTGAFQSKPGLIELANGGSLFLDEICELPIELQVKLLRVLEERTIRPIGGREEKSLDIRLLTATNRDVDEALRKGCLREDLFFRISTIRLEIPPLRERRNDIEHIARHFLRTLKMDYARPITGFTDMALTRLRGYNWPGNVRELQNVVEQAYYLADPPLIRAEDLPDFTPKSATRQSSGRMLELPLKAARELLLAEFERTYLLQNLQRHNWNITQTAKTCGLDRRSIHRLIRKYALTREDPE